MPKKILSIVETAYRATLEEQDDPVLWLNHVLKGAGGEVSVLLQGNAVNYAVKGQDASGLAFGGRQQTQPPKLDRDVTTLAQKGVTVLFVEDDATERGILPADLIEGVEPIRRTALPRLLAGYDQIFHW